MATWKPAYLIHGDDHGRIAERRARLRARAEEESGAGGLEAYEGEQADPEAIAASLSAMTFAMGRRFIVVEGVERWKESDVEPLAAALKDPPPETTIVFFAREEGRAKAPKKLHDAVKKVDGVIDAVMNVSPRELPEWVVERARELGLRMDRRSARALIGEVGDRQQRLLRELEKLELALGAGATVTEESIEELAASSAELKRWAIGDALVAGDAERASKIYLELRSQGERVAGLVFPMSGALRDACSIAGRLDAGESANQIKSNPRMIPFRAAQYLRSVSASDRERLRRAVALMADLEYESRGGGATMDEDTAALRAIAAVES